MNMILGSDFKGDAEDCDRRRIKGLYYKTNIDIVDFYSGMHVEEFLKWILDVENFSSI